jgi:eukaryotic-like serine/threonine-protein kinase
MDESTAVNEPTQGTLSDQRIGSYRVVEPLGSGGMSSVFRAVHDETGHEVALKVLTRSLARNSTLLQRFMREARSAETLEHQNIVTIYDRGIDRGRHYLVLEYVAGGDFHEHVQRQGPLRANDAISIVRSVASGLRYAASRGLIHRDIKPSNILRTPSGQVKIIDLGLALQNEFEDERVTREGTTVGTVDYMAPEQARDSRATSIQSDIYSLGCTTYYLLTGVAAYPGGDITDKLTRHARSPVPDVRDLRPDIAVALSAIIQKMMAKKPDDRFGSYDELIAALDAATTEGAGEAQEIALIPLADARLDDPPPLLLNSWPDRESGEYAVKEAKADSRPLPVVSLAELALEQSDEIRERPATRAIAALAPIPRMGRDNVDVVDDEPSEFDELQPAIAPVPAPNSGSVWIVAGAFIGISLIVLTLGLLQFMESTTHTTDAEPAADINLATDRSDPVAPVQRLAVVANSTLPSRHDGGGSLKDQKTGVRDATPKWVEPVDVEPSRDARAAEADALFRSKVLPEWARSAVPDRINGPFVIVRRVVESSEPLTVPTLYMALDQKIGGTVEIADEGPFFNDDFRVAGDSRLIRARPGYRPIVRVERSSSQAVRNQRAVFVLDRQNLILDGIDLVVDVRDVYPEQTALFSCAGSTLTLRNCSITVLNHNNTSFSIVRVEPGGSLPTRIRLDQTFVRGGFTAGVDLTAGPAELSFDKTVMVGGPGPVVRVKYPPAAAETRFYFVDSILAGPGPAIELSGKEQRGPTRPLSIRAFGSVFGRLHGAGVASVISSSSASEGAAKRIDWKGDRNLFAGWKGIFACGNEPIVTVPGVAEVRSTWNGTDQDSHEILSPWPYPLDLAAVAREELAPFVPGREKILSQVAQPRPGLFRKAIGEYPAPLVPQLAGWAFEQPAPTQRSLQAPTTRSVTLRDSKVQSDAATTPKGAGDNGPITDSSELTFDTSAPPWGGDLGAFLRDRLAPAVRHVRLRVIGSGQHRFTPVQLARNLRLEIRVEALAAAEPPSWSPAPSATGTALIELHGGALLISNLILHRDESSHIEHLIDVEDGDLVLSRCQFTAAGASADFAGDLIAFRSPSTRPYPVDASTRVFSPPVDRPVCLLHESLLITAGTALRAELGRGLIALTGCAIAAGDAGVALVPARVSRSRFDADLMMDHCTLTAERSIVRLGPWSGSPGPDRPWLITSRNCAFLAMYDRKTRETVLLRADADALARGVVSWQASDDALDVDYFTAVGDALPSPNRPRDLHLQWIHFWGYRHMNGRITGPRGAGSPPSVRFFDKLRPGRIEPAELLLNRDYHPDRDTLNVGADLGWLSITPRVNRYGRPRN